MVPDGYRVLKEMDRKRRKNIYMAERLSDGCVYIVKEFIGRPGGASGGEDAIGEIGYGDVLGELRAFMRISNPQVPRIVDLIVGGESIYTVEQYVNGVTLLHRIKEVGRFGWEAAVRTAIEVCSVLAHMHGIRPNPIVHRDVKPENIMVDVDNKVWIIDFETIREYDPGSDRDTVSLGTKGYAAPEQYGMGQSTPATDVYAVGVTLMHMVTGMGPAEWGSRGPGFPSLDRVVPDWLASVAARCVEPEPGRRYADCLELLGELTRHAGAPESADAPQALARAEAPSSGIGARPAAAGRHRDSYILTVCGSHRFAAELALSYDSACGKDGDTILIGLDAGGDTPGFYLDLCDAGALSVLSAMAGGDAGGRRAMAEYRVAEAVAGIAAGRPPETAEFLLACPTPYGSETLRVLDVAPDAPYGGASSIPGATGDPAGRGARDPAEPNAWGRPGGARDMPALLAAYAARRFGTVILSVPDAAADP
ncbi:MAG: serine/threonine protein kinase, partial [Oscillospiraceae bacterium]|nr:serine/threonine protein kinase [Oscillospiraceae bacterium]